MTLAVDASIAIAACLAEEDLGDLGDELVAPGLLWSEARSVIHEAAWRGDVDVEKARAAHAYLGRLAIRRRSPARLGDEAWRLADELGWAKTYDAEYVALASLLDCRLVTLDARLRRGAERLGFVVGPTEV